MDHTSPSESEFRNIISENEANVMLPQYASTPKELAMLCSEGWLLSNHIVWVLDQVNRTSRASVALCLNAATMNDLRSLQQKRNLREVKKLIFVLNVGIDSQGTFVSSASSSGCHWALALVDITVRGTPSTVYCDSLGWEYPRNFGSSIQPFLHFFGSAIPSMLVAMAHDTTAQNVPHKCTNLCLNYPLQTCGKVCGVVSVISAVIAAQDDILFKVITGPRQQQRMFLHNPTLYDRYLRRVLMGWFVSGSVDLKYILPATEQPGQKRGAAAPGSPSKAKKTAWGAAPLPTLSTRHQGSARPTDQCPSQSAPNASGQQERNRPSGQQEPKHPNPKQAPTQPPCRNKALPPSDTDQSSPKKAPPEKKSRVCPYYNARLSRRDVLVRHIKTFYPGQSVPHTMGNCNCHECDFVAFTMEQLIFHYNAAHRKQLNIQSKTFQSKQEFDVWWSDTEKTTTSRFVKQREPEKSTEIVTEFYYCNRSEINVRQCVPQHQRKRHIKSQGTSKIKGKCTCHMTVTTNIQTGQVTAVFCLDHTGHEVDLCHLKLSPEMRSFIAAKLSAGIEITKLLSEIRDQFNTVDRDTLLTRKDIQNIKQEYNISHSQKDSNDACSVQLWVEELKENSDNPLIYFKMEGQLDPSNYLLKDDFLLCIQTAFQRDMMKRFSSDMIFIDSTHSTTQYQFLLTTILVADDFGEGIPVAWAISNKEDNSILEVFLHAVKAANNGEDYCSKTIMSDLVSPFYNAWCSVFPVPERRLYCSWHVDKAWRKKLKELVPGWRSRQNCKQCCAH